jgi:hypothetical protein
LPATAWKAIEETFDPRFHETPPSSETNASICPFRLSKGTTTLPLG